MSGPSGTTTDTNATIFFDVNNLQPTQELSAPAVTCTLDSGAPLLCDSPARYSGLPVGDHQVVIKATGSTGSVGSARVAWKIIADTHGQSLRGAIQKALPPWVANFPKVVPPKLPKVVLPSRPKFRDPCCRQRGDPKRLVRAGGGCAADHGLPDNREHPRRVRCARDRGGAPRSCILLSPQVGLTARGVGHRVSARVPTP